MTRPAFARTTLLVLVVLAAALGIPLGHLSPVSPARAATLPLTGNIAGPTAVGVAIQTTYTVSATGGPAEAPNGTQVGIYSYKASYSAVNTTGAAFTPTSGVLVNGTVTLSFTAPNVTEPLTLFVLVNSSYQGTNVTTNLSEAIEIVQPYRFNANLQVGSQAGVSPFYLTVTLDGAPVGSVKVPSLSAGASYPISFPYVVPGGLSPGLAHLLDEPRLRARPRDVRRRRHLVQQLVLRPPVRRRTTLRTICWGSPLSSRSFLYTPSGSARPGAAPRRSERARTLHGDPGTTVHELRNGPFGPRRDPVRMPRLRRRDPRS